VGGAQFITVYPHHLRREKFSMPSTSPALISVSPPPSTCTLRSIALLSLPVNPWTPLMPACCIHSLYTSFGISARPSGLETETVKLVSISLLSVAPALMYYLPSWIATPNPSYEKSETLEGEHTFFSFHLLLPVRRSSMIRALLPSSLLEIRLKSYTRPSSVSPLG